MFHEDPVKVGAVDSYVACNVRNLDGIGVIVFDVFGGFLKVEGCDVGSAFGGLFLHGGEHQEEVAGGGEVVSVVF